MNKAYDVVIIGGGVTGSSTACNLASQPGFDGSVLVVERDPTYHNAPSARATGGFRQQYSTPENVLIGLFGVHFLKHIDEYLAVDGDVPDVGFKEQGYLLLSTPRSLPVMSKNHVMQRELGADILFLDPDALVERFPWLSADGLAGGFFGASNEGWVDPYSLLQAFRRKARALGVDYVKDEAVGLERVGRRIERVVLAAGGPVAAGVVVNAAGARDAAAIAAHAGVELPVEPRKRCAFVFECRDSIGAAPLTILPEGIGFRPEGGSYITNVAPPPGRDPVSHDFEIDYDIFDEIIWPGLAAHVPVFEAVKMVRAYCCHYDVNTLDENVIIGLTPGLDNFHLAAGFSGHGLQQSPAIGRALSELISFGSYRTIDLARFGYERVLEGQPLAETNVY